MAKSEKFSDYSFANMGPPNLGTTANDRPPRKNCRDGTGIERRCCHKWFNKNLMLVVTLSGVVFGVIEGEWCCVAI